MSVSLMQLVARRESLNRAWADVLENDLDDGTMHASITSLARSIGEVLTRLSDELSKGGYRPADLTEANIPKRTGGTRLLHITNARDRIVERSILNAIGPIVDPQL